MLPVTRPVAAVDGIALSARPAFSELHAEARSSTAAAWMILLEGAVLGFRMEATPGKTV
jgi:stage V sporulation protein SpoVS